jgi:hypothetical protein
VGTVEPGGEYLIKSKSLKSFLDEAFGFIGYAGLNPA